MVFEQEAYIGDSELPLVGDLADTPTIHILKRDGTSGSFKGGLRGRNSAGCTGAGEDGGGACPIGGGRCQSITAHWWRPHE
jgi:hypothetical protein